MCRWCVRSEMADRLTAGLAPTRREFLAYAASFALAAASTPLAHARGTAEVIFQNGSIYPLAQPGGAKVEALAISGGKILAAGMAAEVNALSGAATRIVDLKGRTLLPGLIDPHNHTVLSSLLYSLLDNVGYGRFATKAEAVAHMKEVAAKTAPGHWMAFGFYDNLLQGGDFSIADLDAVSTTSPVFLLYVNGHVGAAAKAGIGYSLHSDNPAAGLPLNPLRLVETAVTRRCMVDNSVIGASLALDIDEALRGVTILAARQMGLDALTGSLEAGKEADLTILEADPYATDPAKLSTIKVSETWLAGENVFG